MPGRARSRVRASRAPDRAQPRDGHWQRAAHVLLRGRRRLLGYGLFDLAIKGREGFNFDGVLHEVTLKLFSICSKMPEVLSGVESKNEQS